MDTNQSKKIVAKCRLILEAYKTGKLGQIIMPEDSHPVFKDKEYQVAYFTLPMALNYQRDSYKLWQAALQTSKDPLTQFVFDIKKVSESTEEEIRTALTKYKVALQPNKHINTWKVIATSVYKHWGSFDNLFKAVNYDFCELKNLIQVIHKKDFPYLSGPKIFNYWSFILGTYGGVTLSNRDYIDIAPDTHITQCSVKLGLITDTEAQRLSKDEISFRWREILKGSGIDPIDMHSPFWFWSRNGFLYNIPN